MSGKHPQFQDDGASTGTAASGTSRKWRPLRLAAAHGSKADSDKPSIGMFMSSCPSSRKSGHPQSAEVFDGSPSTFRTNEPNLSSQEFWKGFRIGTTALIQCGAFELLDSCRLAGSWFGLRGAGRDWGQHRRANQSNGEGGNMTDTLYARLGGYDAMVAVTENLLSRLTKDPLSLLNTRFGRNGDAGRPPWARQ